MINLSVTRVFIADTNHLGTARPSLKIARTQKSKDKNKKANRNKQANRNKKVKRNTKRKRKKRKEKNKKRRKKGEKTQLAKEQIRQRTTEIKEKKKKK